MDPRTEPIRQDIDSIRDSMTSKMEQIEAKVRNTVDTTTESVKQIFDVKQQISDHPWAALGISVLAGFAVGSMGESEPTQYEPGQPVRYYSTSPNEHQHPSSRPSYNTSSYSSGKGYNAYQQQQTQPQQQYQQRYNAPQPPQNSMFSDVFGQFSDEFNILKAAAVTSLVNLMRDTIRQNLPQFGDEYDRLRHERDGDMASQSTAYGGNGESGYRAQPSTSSTSSPYTGSSDAPTSEARSTK